MKYYVIYVKYGEVASFDVLDDGTTALRMGEALCRSAGMKRPFFHGEFGSKVTAVGNNWSVTIINREG